MGAVGAWAGLSGSDSEGWASGCGSGWVSVSAAPPPEPELVTGDVDIPLVKDFPLLVSTEHHL